MGDRPSEGCGSGKALLFFNGEGVLRKCFLRQSYETDGSQFEEIEDFMSQTEKIVQDKIVTLYKSLKDEKRNKRHFMSRIKKYVRPNRKDLLNRYDDDTQIYDPEVLVDNTAGVSMRKYSVESLLDILSMVDPWFTLLTTILKLKGDAKLEEEYNQWAVLNQKLLFRFINNSDYPIVVKDDKFIYDSYGFSGMTIGHRDNKLLTEVENPFKLLRVRAGNRTVGCMWERKYREDEMMQEFGWRSPEWEKSEGQDERSSMEYTVIHATVPNNEVFVKNPKKEGKYVQIYVLKDEGYKPKPKVQDGIDMQETHEDESIAGIEIGKRKHFKMLPTVIPTDTLIPEEDYGFGEGEWVVSPATNCNKINKNIIASSSIKAMPPLDAPAEYFLQGKYVQPRMVFPRNPTVRGAGDGIKFIEFKDNLNEQSAILEAERDQVRDSLPTVTNPPKKQRQSMLEIEKAELQRMTMQFAYKIAYLKLGVAEHLKRIFYVAVDLGVLTDLPGDLDWEDVEPSIDNLIEKEKMKLKGQKYVVTASMSQAYLGGFLEGWDNFKRDGILRNIAYSQGIGEDLNTIDDRTKIREERRRQIEEQQRREDAVLRSTMNREGAQATKDAGMGTKAIAEAQNLQPGG